MRSRPTTLKATDAATTCTATPLVAESVDLGLPFPARSRPITVLHVHGRMARGGAEMRTVEIFRHVDRRRFRLHFCALSGLAGELDGEIRRLGGEVHRLRQSRLGFPRRFRDLLRQGRFDAVHSHLHFYSGYVLRLAAECGIPVRVAHFRATRAETVCSPAKRILHRLLGLAIARYASQRAMRGWMDRCATHILGVSESALSSAWGEQWQSDPRCQVVYDGLDLTPFRDDPDRPGVCREFGLPEDAPLLIHVGRFAEPKNHVRLVSMFSAIVRLRPNARLLLVGRTAGAGGARGIECQVRQRLSELGIADRVILAGERSDVPRLLKAADVLLFPSLWEGLGDVVLEACAAGTPVVASDLPSVREMAAQLQGIHRLSLAEPDAAWARLAVEAIDQPPTPPQRRAALESFARSVFTVPRCAAALCRVWECARAKANLGGIADG